MFEVAISDRAEHRLGKLPPRITDDIMRKIYWLAVNATAIKHEHMKGSDEANAHRPVPRSLSD